MPWQDLNVHYFLDGERVQVFKHKQTTVQRDQTGASLPPHASRSQAEC